MFLYNFDSGINFGRENFCGKFFGGNFFLRIVNKTTKIGTCKNLVPHGKHSPSEILSLNFEKRTVYLNCNLFLLHLSRKDTMMSFTQEFWNAVCESGLCSMQHGSFELLDPHTCILHN